jgi:hypothetical protein
MASRHRWRVVTHLWLSPQQRGSTWAALIVSEAQAMTDEELGITPAMRARYRKMQALRLKIQHARDARMEALGIITEP